MERLTVRLGTLIDAQSITDFNLAMALETEQKRLSPETVRAGVESLLAATDAGFYLVAEVNHRVVACLMVTFEWSDWRDGQFWWIQSVYVSPARRRTGVFRALHSEVRRMALSRPNVCGLRLYVERDNEIAQRTYHQLGMTQTPYLMFEQELDRTQPMD